MAGLAESFYRASRVIRTHKKTLELTLKENQILLDLV